MTARETGLMTLMGRKIVPETDYFQFPKSDGTLGCCAETWTEALDAIGAFVEADTPHETLVIDTLGWGMDKLCQEHVCKTLFGGDWGEHGFGGWNKGYDATLPHWRELLKLLDRLRDERGIATISLCHVKVQEVKHPGGPNYDEFQPDMHPKTWSLTKGWKDDVVYLCHEAPILQKTKDVFAKGKQHGRKVRMAMACNGVGYVASNRSNVTDDIVLSSESPKQAWADLESAMRGG